MQYKLISHENGNEGLLIFFLGWSCAPESLKEFSPKGWDLLLLYDYRELSLPEDFDKIIFSYTKHSLIAHSFGVWVAGHHMCSMPTLESSIAICGSLLPVDDEYGIPKKIFDFTLKTIKSKGIEKFNARMCGDDFDKFTPSNLSFDEQCSELVALSNYFVKYPIAKEDASKWSAAVICSKDQIFPEDNLLFFWKNISVEITAFRNRSHFPFFGNFIHVINHLL